MGEEERERERKKGKKNVSDSRARKISLPHACMHAAQEDEREIRERGED